MNSGERWKALGKAARDRRLELGHRYQTGFAKVAGIADRTMNAIETGNMRGRKDFDPATKHLLETALRWVPGSVDRILNGGEPVELPPPAPEGSPLSKMGSRELIAQINELVAEISRRLPDDPRVELDNDDEYDPDAPGLVKARWDATVHGSGGPPPAERGRRRA